MPSRWRICDKDWFWFISFTQHDYDPIEGDRIFADINLWPCRRCGAMVMGTMRTQHEKFHETYPMEATGLE